jgi:hypothetical protein
VEAPASAERSLISPIGPPRVKGSLDSRPDMTRDDSPILCARSTARAAEFCESVHARRL